MPNGSLKLLTLAGGFVLLSGNALAQNPIEDLSWYGGIGVGAAEADSDRIDVGDDDAFGRIDDESTAFKLFVGANFNEYVGVEAGYVTFGEVEGDDEDDDLFDEATSFDADGWTASVVGFWPATDRFLVHARAGYLSWETETRVGAIPADDDGSDGFYGVGATYEFTEEWAIRGEYDLYELDETDIDTLWFSAVFSF